MAAGQAVPLIATGQGARPIEMAFPSDGPVTLTFDPPSSAGDLAFDGPWSALRLVLLHRLQPTAQPDRFRLTVQRGERTAEFVVVAQSSVNVFGLLRDLGEFRCPTLPPPAPG